MDQVHSNKMTMTTNGAGPGQRRDAECSFGPIRTCLTILGLYYFISLLHDQCTDQNILLQPILPQTKKLREISEDDLVKALKDRLRKAGLNGYTDPVAALKEIKRIAVKVLESYVPGDHYTVFGFKFQLAITGASCLQERKVKFRPVPCQCKECHFLIDVGSVCWVKDHEEGQITTCSTCHKKRSFISVKLRMFERQNMTNAEWVTFEYLKTDVCLPPSPNLFIIFYFTKMAWPSMNKEFKKAGRPFKWEYKQGITMLFPQLEGSEFPIVLFNSTVNEYPSTRTVSLSYIDSVKFFEPENLRWRSLQPAIFPYVDQARRRLISFEKLTIWVCPPNEGDEYVFYGRDETNSRYVRGINQGIIQWYSAILNAALTERIINDYDHPTDEKFPDYLQIPYMAEDFWPQQLEEILEAHRKQVEEHNASSRSAPKKRGGKAHKKAGTNASGLGGLLSSIKERVKEVTDNEKTMEALYLVKLEPLNAETDFVNDEEEAYMLCSYMSNRDNFILDCRGNDYDFFTSRRARFSTVKMCCSQMAIEVSNGKCRHCEKSLTEGVYCFVCLDAAYCTDCAHVYEHFATLRQFRVPFCVSELHPSPIFRMILEILEREASWLTNVAKVLYTPEGMQPYDINTKEQACMLNYHHAMLNRRIRGHEENKQAHCRTCSAAYFPLQRHKEFCKGMACYVPSCGKDLLFDNAGRTLSR